jgi:hypothetical protein
MPFKSKAQRRKFAQLLVEGKITPEVFEEWNRETGRARLPERAAQRKKNGRKATTRRKRKATGTRNASGARGRRARGTRRTERKQAARKR